MWKQLPPPLDVLEICKMGRMRKRKGRRYIPIQNMQLHFYVTINKVKYYIRREQVYRSIFGQQLIWQWSKKRKKRKKKPKKYKRPYKPNDKLFADGIEKLSAEDCHMRAIEDLFFGFNSYTGVTAKQATALPEHYLTEQQAEQLGLEPFVEGSMLFISAKKQLYLWNGSHYVLLTKDSTIKNRKRSYHPLLTKPFENQQVTD